MTTEADADLFRSIGLDETLSVSTAKNKKKCAALKEVLHESGWKEGSSIERNTAILLQSLSVKCPETVLVHRHMIAKAIADRRILKENQLSAGIKYCQTLPLDIVCKDDGLNAACGVGVEVSSEEISSFLQSVIDPIKEVILFERYTYPFHTLIYKVQEHDRFKWADGKIVTSEVDSLKIKLLGPQTDSDLEMMKEKKSKGKKKESAEVVKKEVSVDPRTDSAFEARDLKAAQNSEALLRAHAELTKGMIQTRFPPEPNGYLHIGHAKSMYLNFKHCFEKLGKAGECTFRYDDTNPEAESQEFIDNLAENVKWLGWKPVKTTFSSDYFDELYELARELIRRGKAFVCHQTKAEMEKCREISQLMIKGEYTGSDVPESPYRNRSVEENLKLFQDMRDGKFAEGAAILRMKMDMRSVNPNMWDQVAYRIKNMPHPHAGDKWIIYPSYDYTHCIIDSLENIDFSLCTLEFETRRDSYYWLLEALDLWRPHVWEFGRLDLTYTVMSKRKLKQLVMENFVSGWDDPRLPTLNGLRRRGYTPAAINAFCADIGVSRVSGTTTDFLKLEHAARQDLEVNARRAMVVMDPLRVIIENYEEGKVELVSVPDFPADPSRGVHQVPFQKVVFIDQSDFKSDGADDKSYFGLAPGKTCYLKGVGKITYSSAVYGTDGRPTEIKVKFDNSTAIDNEGGGKKAKIGVLTWVASPKYGQLPRTAEIRLYEKLFTVPDPGSKKDFTEFLNKASLEVKTAYIDESLAIVKPLQSFQFERVAFFVVDLDSKDEHIIFNRIVSLKESKEFKEIKDKK